MIVGYGKELIMDLQGCDPQQFREPKMRRFLDELCMLLKMKRHGEPLFWEDFSDTPHLRGTSAMQFITTSNIVIHGLDHPKTALINVFSCKEFDREAAFSFSKQFFKAKTGTCRLLVRNIMARDNPKVEVREHPLHGKGLIAKDKIYESETIAVFDGRIRVAQKASVLPNEQPSYIRDHSIQFAPTKYRDSRGIARYCNHSCDPNCGIKERFKLVAMRDIDKDEELTFDYDMSENSDWIMSCSCQSSNCRKRIEGYRSLPLEVKEKYKGYISDWLVNPLAQKETEINSPKNE